MLLKKLLALHTIISRGVDRLRSGRYPSSGFVVKCARLIINESGAVSYRNCSITKQVLQKSGLHNQTTQHHICQDIQSAPSPESQNHRMK